tara:strand:+ start:317 stop:604 length:288 start_codon:yes stop_codon:yes gene_type:complete
MKRLLLPLLAALALPTAVNATNYVECEAMYRVYSRISEAYMDAFKAKVEMEKDMELVDKYVPHVKELRIENWEYQKERRERITKDAKKRGCDWTF